VVELPVTTRREAFAGFRLGIAGDARQEAGGARMPAAGSAEARAG
jgi:hypothetical protein